MTPSWALPWVAAAGTYLWGTYHRNSPLFGKILTQLPTDERWVALTFDDGPNPDATPDILTTLKREGVPATFFMLGRHVEQFPDVAARVAQESPRHTIGNHGWSHRKLSWAGPATTRREIDRGAEAIVAATGVRPRWFRAPHGFRSPFVAAAASQLQHRLVGWTLGVWDSDRPGEDEIARRVLAGVTPGCVILLHDGDGYSPSGDRLQTARALPKIIAGLRARGYGFVALD